VRPEVFHHLTVDVEEFFHPTALEKLIPPSEWESLPRRAPAIVRRLLERLDARHVRATFFVLGWLAEKEPEMVRAIADSGHEVASHGWSHQRVTRIAPETFRDEVRRSRALLEDLSGARVEGYRAPSFSILPGMEWAFDVLLEEGYRYDSSVFPVKTHPDYGYPDAQRDPHLMRLPSGVLAEVPLATLRLGGTSLPAAGGAYLRFFGVRLPKAALSSAARRGVPGTLYMHPWEFDGEMPSFDAPWLTRLRMRGGIRTMWKRVDHLLQRFRYRPVRESVAELLDTADTIAP
jgi:polysaccharide deacetylase family protein (PEP-CTERM system associated)